MFSLGFAVRIMSRVTLRLRELELADQEEAARSAQEGGERRTEST